jgi:aldehyde dehydrogenase (NAD+)
VARKNSRSSTVVALPVEKSLTQGSRVALPPGERTLSFGDKWAYAPAPEAHNYIELKPRYQHFINGRFVAPHSGKYFPSINPATEEQLAEIADGDAYDVDAAVKAARAAYKNVWGKNARPRTREISLPDRAAHSGEIA